MRHLIVTSDLLADLRRYNAGIARAKRAYYRDETAEQHALARAKAVRHAAAVKRSRDRKKRATP